jgi:D-amino peptidase
MGCGSREWAAETAGAIDFSDREAVFVVMISGDDAIVDEARSLLGDIEGAIVKWNYGESAARTLMPEAAFKLIREKVDRALGRLGDFAP